jgi:hypothetical protein
MGSLPVTRFPPWNPRSPAPPVRGFLFAAGVSQPRALVLDPAVGFDVPSWHLADVPLALTNVCLEGKNGHDAGMTPFPLMT